MKDQNYFSITLFLYVYGLQAHNVAPRAAVRGKNIICYDDNLWIVSEAPTSDVLMLPWELPRPGHAPVLSPYSADTGNSGPGSPWAPGTGTGLLTVTCYLRSDLGSGLGDYVWPGQSRQ